MQKIGGVATQSSTDATLEKSVNECAFKTLPPSASPPPLIKSKSNLQTNKSSLKIGYILITSR